MENKMNFDIDPLMGKKVRDLVTGIEGIICGFAMSISGCKQYIIRPKAEKGAVARDGVAVDEGRVKVIGQGIRPKIVKQKKERTGAIVLPKSLLMDV